METISIQIKDSSKRRFLLEMLAHFDFVEILKNGKEKANKQKVSPSKPHPEDAEKDDFMAAAGMWEGRDITVEKIREKAWPKRKW